MKTSRETVMSMIETKGCGYAREQVRTAQISAGSARICYDIIDEYEAAHSSAMSVDGDTDDIAGGE